MRSLADVVGASGLSGYAIVALILFFLAFVAVAISVFLPGRAPLYDRASRMPLDDLNPQTPREP